MYMLMYVFLVTNHHNMLIILGLYLKKFSLYRPFNYWKFMMINLQKWPLFSCRINILYSKLQLEQTDQGQINSLLINHLFLSRLCEIILLKFCILNPINVLFYHRMMLKFNFNHLYLYRLIIFGLSGLFFCLIFFVFMFFMCFFFLVDF